MTRLLSRDDATVASHLEHFRRPIVTIERRAILHPSRTHELRATAHRVVSGSLPGARSGWPTQVDLARLRTLDVGTTPQLWTESNIHLLEGMLIAHVRLDDLDGALALIDAHFTEGRLRGRAVLGLDSMASLFAAVAEAYASAGRPRDAGLYVSRALTFADSDTVRYRAAAVQTLALAVNGEFASAKSAREACAELSRSNRWNASDTDHALALADIILAVGAVDAARVERAAAVLRSLAPRDPYAQHAAATADAIAQVMLGDVVTGAAGLRTVLGGAWSHLSHRLVRQLALSVLAEATLAQGSARRALALLDTQVPPASHAVCFNAQRAAAYLALGDDRAALEVTDGCLELGTEHCPRTLAIVLVRRAVARDRLGQREVADDLFDEACGLAVHAGDLVGPFLTVPQTQLTPLRERLRARHPDLAARVAEASDRFRLLEPRASAQALPALTPRERSVASALRGGKTYAEIAGEFTLSVNTIKTQLRSLYAKLGASTRDEAVSMLERHGFYL
ncbi:DNA-binding CsgD family transcriptional regulator/tetratricopeptide (TPR) repeat protein [Microbacterium paludicola]|uniref:DNA-binding CsgD family transcriptional regulator/tetratricopeptide (TPR) repeat protein n=1 Tax=Microbacterium paludicola TaxID=300019 RepID=A0ABU1I389_9MICO|nr:LuxR C-terminal-related transcriptional regulator [Microbacterium paludicola]MDR6167419.1 DNA-binding CsgD family transcriptional regulator/tetratricopeptide (TPR) repeat protein [Microbacterium paludicola]